MSVLHKNLCYDPSSELSQRDSSDVGSKHMVSMRNKKKYPNHQILLLCRALLIGTYKMGSFPLQSTPPKKKKKKKKEKKADLDFW